jgi:hypothetical protein
MEYWFYFFKENVSKSFEVVTFFSFHEDEKFRDVKFMILS